jgi:hypothetical protein
VAAGQAGVGRVKEFLKKQDLASKSRKY